VSFPSKQKHRLLQTKKHPENNPNNNLKLLNSNRKDIGEKCLCGVVVRNGFEKVSGVSAEQKNQWNNHMAGGFLKWWGGFPQLAHGTFSY